jgi:transaldolase / glucose-6-phosphate isomerase
MTERIEMAGPTMELDLGDGAAAYHAAAQRAVDERWVERLFERDTTLWSTDPRVQAGIAERLGWLDAPEHFFDQIAALEGFGDGIRDDGFTAAIVAGMGGSSLAPDVLNRTFGTSPGYLALRILDSTDPAAVAATVDDLDPLATLFMVSTKSGTTTEPHAFLADAWARTEAALHARGGGRESPGQLMIAITDPPPSADAIPHHDDLRELFLNPPDIGGRYSALTYVGLVPASLIGLDLDPLMASAMVMMGRCRASDPAVNPGLSLGIAIGSLARAGRDKLTFIADADIASFGSWVEQLIAESTGKHGVGIVPVDLEPLGVPAAYGPDRAFVRLTVGSSAPVTPDGRGPDALLDDLAKAGHPVIRIGIPDPIDLGGEFARWEVATAIAGIILGIDPFDQPNVEEAKEHTRRLLSGTADTGTGTGTPSAPAATAGAPGHEPDTAVGTPGPASILASNADFILVGDTPLRLTHGDGTPLGELRRHLARIRPTSYLALQAYVRATPARDEVLARIRALLRDRTTRATTLGYGPRFLHSTGQLHKGGPPVGWFIQFTADHPVDRAIPGWPYTFGHLIDAQALGDFQTLESHELPILRVHLGLDPDGGLASFERLLAEALQEARP